MAVSISQISFEHHRLALGIAETQPRLSWRFAGDAPNWLQTSYDIEITRSGNTTNSFTVVSADSLYNPWPDSPLGPTDQASVRARAHGGSEQPSTPWSDWVTVETGLLDRKDWKGAVPIAAERQTEIGKAKRPVHFRKDFKLGAAAIKSARLYITALGLYEAEINGVRVGDHVLAPGWQSYNFRHVYDTYDVTDMIKNGDNALGILVGEGWFAGRMGGGPPTEHWGNTLSTIALLKVTLEDGSTVEVASDTSWKSNTGPIVTSEIYNGEGYDSRLDATIKGWSSPGFESKNWLATKKLPPIKGVLSSPDGPPIRKMQEVKVQRVSKSPSGKTILDFGQNLVGWLRLNNVQGPSGTEIILKHAEVLQKGELAIEPLRSAKATDTLILHGAGRQTWEPRFTFHGFRYVQVDGWPEGVPMDIVAIVVHTDMEPTGDFTCSHDFLNKFHSNVRWSMRGNFLSIPTDCPQRDERLGWTGDAHAFCPTANFLYDTAGFWKSWHKDLWSEMQRGGRMVVPHYVPTLPVDSKDWAGAYWGDVAVGNPWAIYKSFGDVGMLKEQFPQGRGWIDKGIPRSATKLWERSGPQFGDWLDPKAPPNDAGGATTHRYLVADAYLVEMTRVLGQISTVLGDNDTASKYFKDHEMLRSEFQKSWMVDGAMKNRTQTAYALALNFDLYTDQAQRTAAAETLRSIVKENNYLVGTGFAGTPALGPAMERIGATQDFYRMLLQVKVPSWLYQVVQGGTTTWERWDSMREDGTINDSGMTSFNHYAFGTVADWVHGVVGGLRPKEAGWRVIEVKPVPGGGITFANTTYVSGYGEIRVGWKMEGEAFRMTVEVPPNSKAEVTLPTGGETKVVGSGIHSF